MITQGFKNYMKTRSLGNLSIVDDNSNDNEEAPLSAHTHFRAEKHNLSSTNDNKRELLQKLKEFSDHMTRSSENGYRYEIPHLPERNLDRLLGTISRESYHQQSALWELLETEQNFLKQIHFIVEFYISAFESLGKDFFPKINASEIFSNLREVYRVSLEFWKTCMEPLVKEIVNTNNSLQSYLLKDGFTKIGEILEPYITYCSEITTCRTRITSLEKGNALFAEYIKWAMNLQQSNRESLCDHLMKPVQRLTKYNNLLEAIQKYSSSNEKSDLQEMIEAVKCFVTTVNKKIEEKALMGKLLYLSKQIDSYDVIDPLGDDVLPIVNKFNNFDLTTPIMIGETKIIRQLSHQGEMKLREGLSKTIDIKLFLFTDILLLTKSKKKTLNKMKIIKPPIPLDKTKFQKISNNSFACVCLNEFNCISSLYHLSCGDSKRVDEWLQKLDDAEKHYLSLRQSQADISLAKDILNTIPEVKVVDSSPKRNRFKNQSNSDRAISDDNAEYSIKRKSPVARKHKNRKINSYYGVEVAFETPELSRKNSNPTITKTESHFIRKLSKSNSFQEGDKQTMKENNDNSDIDDVTVDNYAVQTRRELPMQSQRDISDSFVFIDAKKHNSAPVYSSNDKLNKSLSKSLNNI